MRSLARPLALIAVLMAAGLMWSSAASAQEPTFEVTPDRAACGVAPFEIRASGLEPSRPVLVDITVAGAVTGQVSGTTDSLGQFDSPIPMILLPCADGGEVSASITVGGERLPLVARFEVADSVVSPPTATATSRIGAAEGTPRPPAAGTGAGGVSAQTSSLWVLVFIGSLATFGMAATWVTRPRD